MSVVIQKQFCPSRHRTLLCNSSWRLRPSRFYRSPTSPQCYRNRICNHSITTLSRRLRYQHKYSREDRRRPNGHRLHWSGFPNHLPQHDAHEEQEQTGPRIPEQEKTTMSLQYFRCVPHRPIDLIIPIGVLFILIHLVKKQPGPPSLEVTGEQSRVLFANASTAVAGQDIPKTPIHSLKQQRYKVEMHKNAAGYEVFPGRAIEGGAMALMGALRAEDGCRWKSRDGSDDWCSPPANQRLTRGTNLGGISQECAEAVQIGTRILNVDRCPNAYGIRSRRKHYVKTVS